MKKIHNFGLFLESLEDEHELEYNLKNKKKEKKDKKKNKKVVENFALLEAAGGSEVQKEAKKIIGEMFAVGKNIKFSGDQDGEPQYVEFEIDANDYKLGYSEDLKMEYSSGVLAKRKYQVSLKYSSKSKEGTNEKPIYKIKFKINLKPASEVKSKEKEIELAWEFEDKPTKVIDFIKKGKQKCEWDSSDNRLYISKSCFDKLATDQLKVLIREEGGQKIRIK